MQVVKHIHNIFAFAVFRQFHIVPNIPNIGSVTVKQNL